MHTHTYNEGISNAIRWLKGSFSFSSKLARTLSFLATDSVQTVPGALDKKWTSLFSASKMKSMDVLGRCCFRGVLGEECCFRDVVLGGCCLEGVVLRGCCFGGDVVWGCCFKCVLGAMVSVSWS